ncbi:MAG: MOSC domain-containing protein [Hyphomicrobiaceae bacterium]
MSNQNGRVAELYRYPVKGLTPHRLEQVGLEPGRTFPRDRAYAIENGPGRFDPLAPKHLPKINFLMLMRNEQLAAIKTEFDDANDTLTIKRDGKQVARGQLTTRVGRAMIEQFIAGYMPTALRGAPKIVASDGHTFSDVAAHCVHIVNLETVRALERVVQREVHPLRFRANIYADGLPAWSEFDWIDKTIAVGDIRMRVWARTQRCDATNVDPLSAARDMSIPATLQRAFGHTDLGVYASIIDAGVLRAGDRITTDVR